jgi:site-specific recombinase XerD
LQPLEKIAFDYNVYYYDQPIICYLLIFCNNLYAFLNSIGKERRSVSKRRVSLRVRKVFLVQKGTHKGKPLSVRGIQKRMEFYAKKAGLAVSCHQLRHTMATQLHNADADLVSIQDLLGHSRIKTTQRYCRVSNLKVQRDYFNAMQEVMKRTAMNNNFA